MAAINVIEVVVAGPQGRQGNDGTSTQAGGETDQVLSKQSGDDHDTGWRYPKAYATEFSSSSGLVSTKVQGAIDEVHDAVLSNDVDIVGIGVTLTAEALRIDDNATAAAAAHAVGSQGVADAASAQSTADDAIADAAYAVASARTANETNDLQQTAINLNTAKISYNDAQLVANHSIAISDNVDNIGTAQDDATEALGKANSNISDIEDLLTSVGMVNAEATGPDTLVLNGHYTVDTQLPNSEATGIIHVTKVDSSLAIVQRLTSTPSGKEYTRSASNGVAWSGWVEDTLSARVTSPVSVNLEPQVNALPYKAGKVYTLNDALILGTQYPTVDLTLGVNGGTYIEVYNNTGVTIEYGKVCRYVNMASGKPSVVLAQADTFTGSFAIGVAAMNIPHDSTGILSTGGLFNDMDLHEHSAGDIVYLSDTEAGGLTSVAPDIATRVGIVFSSDAVIGKLFVNPESHVTLPTIYGELSGGTAGTSFTADTYQAVNTYTADSSVVLGTNVTNGTIVVPTSGKYRLSANFVLAFDDIGTGAETLTLGVSDGSSIVREIPVFLAKSASTGAFTPSVMFDAVAGTTYHLELKCSYALTNVTYALSSFDITSVHIR